MKRYAVIACEILYREISFCAAMSENIVDTYFQPKGLHDLGAEKMRQRLQTAVDQIDTEKYEAILFAYGLCNNGILGLTAALPMVIPRCHDCITLLMGSRQKYSAYFNKNPGSFYKSAGWLERDTNPGSVQDGVMSQLGLQQNYLEDYDEETAAYLADMLGSWVQNYKQFTFIDTKIGDSRRYEEMARVQAEDLSLGFDRIEGNLCLLQNLLGGEWKNDFLVVQPGFTAAAAHNDEIITAKAIER